MAEEPLMVCMMRKIVLTSSSEKLSFSSAAKTRLSSCSSRELVSKRYASKMLSFPLPIGTSFLCVELLMFRSTGLAKK